MKNIQISTSDLVGNKFNGYDLHLYLKEREIDSKQIVEYKISDDPDVYEYDFNHRDAIKNLMKKRTIFEADIIHLQLIHNFFDINYLPFFTKLKPTILSFHDPFFLGGHCVHHFDCDKWQSKCCDCPYLDVTFEIDRDYSNLNFEILKDAVHKSQISILVTSNWMMEKVKKSPIWKDKDIYYLPFGINTDLFKPNDDSSLREKFGIPKENLVLMFRADSGLFKGLDIIKKALESLKDMKNITLIAVANTGQLEEFRDYFQIIEYGWINDDDLLANLYQVCDIFLMPSRQETFGLMAVEAMACGKTVLSITGEGTALPDVIDSPRCGIAVSEDKYPEQLKELVSDPKLLKEHGDKSLELVKEKYTKEKYIDGIIDIYKKVIKRHKLDADAKFILEQLDRYMPDSDTDFDYGNVLKYNDCRIRLIELENEFNLKCQELASKNEELDVKNSELAEIRNKFQLKENEVNNIYNSRSWKLIRAIRHKMKFWR